MLLPAAISSAMRLRVKCSSAYVLGDLQWCMVHVPEHIRSIRDLAGHVSRLLELNVRGGNGTEPQVSMDGYLIPYGEEVRNVLRDNEVVDVAPMGAGCSTLMDASQTPQLASKRGSKDVNGTDADTEGITRDKRARREVGANGHAAVAAIGWQPPEESASTKVPVVADAAGAEGKRSLVKKAEVLSTSVPAKVSKAAAPKARVAAPPSSSSETESDDDDSSEEDPPPKRPKGVGAVVAASGDPAREEALNKAQISARAAQAAALATCSSEHGAALEEGRGDTDDQGCSLFVGGLPYELAEADFRRHFEFYGAVDSATIVMNNNTGKPKGFGFIEFAKAESRAKALADGPYQQIAGKQVEIKPRQGKGGKAKGKGGKGKGGKGKGGKDGAKFGSKGGKGGESDKDGGKAGAGGKGSRNADGVSVGSKHMQATPALPSTLGTAAPPANEDIGEEEAELQRQMAALGLPVCFTATEARTDESDDSEDDGVSEGDSDK